MRHKAAASLEKMHRANLAAARLILREKYQGILCQWAELYMARDRREREIETERRERR